MSRGNAYPVRNKLSYNQGNPTNGGGTSIVFPGAPVVQVNQRSDFVIPTSHVTSSTKSLVGESPLYTLAPEELKAINSNTRPRDQLQARKKGPKNVFFNAPRDINLIADSSYDYGNAAKIVG